MAPYTFILLPDDSSLYSQEGQVSSPQGDAGVDIPTPADVVVPPGEVVLVDLGVKAVCMKEMHTPGGGHSTAWAYRMVPRSSISKTPLMMANSEGIIDAGYRGSLKAAVRNVTSEEYTIKKGTALFQLVFPDLSPYSYDVVKAGSETAELFFGEGATARGAGGFGSTGASGSAGAAETG